MKKFVFDTFTNPVTRAAAETVLKAERDLEILKATITYHGEIISETMWYKVFDYLRVNKILEVDPYQANVGVDFTQDEKGEPVALNRKDEKTGEMVFVAAIAEHPELLKIHKEAYKAIEDMDNSHVKTDYEAARTARIEAWEVITNHLIEKGLVKDHEEQLDLKGRCVAPHSCSGSRLGELLANVLK